MGHQTREHIILLDKLAILSRLFAAALLCLTSVYLPLFDASPRILVPHTTFSSISSSLLRWDTFYFSTIAKDGYLYEYYWAFFPGLPWLSRLADILPAFQVDSTTATHAWVALLHVALAAPTTRAIYNLTLIHFRSPSFSFLTALLSLLPASPVTLYFAPYAEPIFTFLSYRGMLACAHGRYLPASLYFAVAAAFRSNGLLLALYVPWSLIIDPFLTSSTLPRPSVVLLAFLHTLLPLMPSLLHQFNAYRAFCLATDSSLSPPWCNDFIPSIYTHVQRTYWHVGFLSYWTFTQLPNILLALPLLVPLLLYSISHISLLVRGKLGGRLRPLKMTAHAVHAAIFGLTILTNAHTQIALRLLPALPSTYWAAAALVVERPQWGRAYIIWAVLWGATSIVLWAAFLPPA